MTKRQTTQWPKEKVEKDTQRTTKHVDVFRGFNYIMRVMSEDDY